MRQLWRMACGRIDLEVAGKAFLIALLGGQVDETTLAAMHPLRSVETTIDGGADGEPKAVKPMTAAEQSLFDELTGG